MKETEIKTMTLDLSKTLSYLTELAKSNNQNYVTKEGMALLEGVVIGGNDKVTVVDKRVYDRLNDIRAEEELDYRKSIKEFKNFPSKYERDSIDLLIKENRELQSKVDTLVEINKQLKKKKGWF